VVSFAGHPLGLWFGSTISTCRSGDVVKNGQLSDGSHEQVLNSDSDHQMLTSIFLLHDVALKQVCQKGYFYESGAAWMEGVSKNHSGGVSNTTLTITRQ